MSHTCVSCLNIQFFPLERELGSILIFIFLFLMGGRFFLLYNPKATSLFIIRFSNKISIFVRGETAPESAGSEF